MSFLLKPASFALAVANVAEDVAAVAREKIRHKGWPDFVALNSIDYRLRKDPKMTEFSLEAANKIVNAAIAHTRVRSGTYVDCCPR